MLDILLPIITDIKCNHKEADETLIFCKTYDDCLEFFSVLSTKLNEQYLCPQTAVIIKSMLFDYIIQSY